MRKWPILLIALGAMTLLLLLATALSWAQGPGIEPTGEMTPQSLSGSTVSITPAYFLPGQTYVFDLEVYNGSPDQEYVYTVTSFLPPAFIIHSLGYTGSCAPPPPYSDGCGFTMPDHRNFDNFTGECRWWSTGDLGDLYNGWRGHFLITATVPSTFTWAATVSWVVEGDGYGDPPHVLSGSLTLTPTLGWLTGVVTDATTGAPLTASLHITPGDVLVSTDPATGVYTQLLPADVYTVTAMSFGYLSQDVGGVRVETGQVTTQNFALNPLPTGELSGRVTNANTGGAVVGALVEVDERSTTTDAQGRYTMTLPIGTYTVTASAPLYGTVSVPEVRVLAGTLVLVQDIALPAAWLKWSPATISAEAGWNETVTHTLTISNAGGLPLNFNLSTEELDWLSVTPSSGSLTPGDKQPVTLTLDAGQVLPGVYQAALTILHNDPSQMTVTVPVTLQEQGMVLYLPVVMKNFAPTEGK